MEVDKKWKFTRSKLTHKIEVDKNVNKTVLTDQIQIELTFLEIKTKE